MLHIPAASYPVHTGYEVRWTPEPVWTMWQWEEFLSRTWASMESLYFQPGSGPSAEERHKKQMEVTLCSVQCYFPPCERLLLCVVTYLTLSYEFNKPNAPLSPPPRHLFKGTCVDECLALALYGLLGRVSEWKEPGSDGPHAPRWGFHPCGSQQVRNKGKIRNFEKNIVAKL